MTILPRIKQIVQERFGTFFDSIEGFYLKNFLILIQGLLTNSYTSISAIAADEHYGVSHTTLFRFLQSHEEFWVTMKNLLFSLFRRQMVGEGTSQHRHILVIDDTQIARRGKLIPFASKHYDHCDNRFILSQVILTIGEVKNKVFQPLEMLFAKPSKEEGEPYRSKIEMAISWLKDHSIRGAIIIADSWYTNAPLIESCKKLFESDFIGRFKSNIILCIDGEWKKVKDLVANAPMNRTFRLGNKVIRYHSFDAKVQSLRILVKVVVTELEDGSRALLACTDRNLPSEAIIEYYSLRWTIESFFKFAKQNLSLAKCHSRDESAQSHFLILIAIAYLIFNDLLRILQTSEENLTHCELFYVIRLAFSIFAVTYFSRSSVRTTESFLSECRYSKASQRVLVLLLHPRTG